MSEEGNSSPAKINGATPDNSPQEDGSKVLIASNENAKIDEAKFKKGDAEIDVGIPKAFSGLTKEELMKYSNDPFWVRLRMFLFVLFWVLWATMLILAIVIIVKAPACEPPPVRIWVEEQAIIEIAPTNLPDIKELETKMDSVSILSAYFPGLISLDDFMKPTYDVKTLITELVGESSTKKAVVDIPLVMTVSNPLYYNATEDDLIYDDGTWNYNSTKLPAAMIDYFLDYWIDEGITGFLIAEPDAKDEEIKTEFKKNINKLLQDKKAAVGSNLVDFSSVQTNFTSSNFSAFLEDNAKNWAYYKFNPEVPKGGSMTQEDERLATIGLFMYAGTPMLTQYDKLDNSTSDLMKKLTFLRAQQSVKVGEVNMANTTSNVVAFTRTYKGTPAYAVALNFANTNETVSFSGTPNLNSEGTAGTVEIDSQHDSLHLDMRDKVDLLDFNLKPFQGLVIQFVANF